jgi:hypothetical protein
MDNTNNSLKSETAVELPINNKVEQIPKRLVFGMSVLFIAFLIASIILGILNSKLAWLPLAIFLFLFISTATIYFILRINRSVKSKKQEEILALRRIEKDLLALATKSIDEIVKRHAEGYDG